MKKCEVCGKERPNRTRRFCSNHCSLVYRHSHKDEYKNYFKQLRKGAHKRFKRKKCLQCGKINNQSRNKFCSKKCYRIYRIQHPDEFEYAYSRMREKLRKLPERKCDNCGVKFLPCGQRYKRFCSSKCYNIYVKNNPDKYKESRRIATEKTKKSLEKFKQENPDRYAAMIKKSSERMKKNNPMKDIKTKKKAMESCKKYWDSHPEEKNARIKRFMNASCRGRSDREWTPTSLEKKIIALNIPGLNYVGNGAVFVTIGCSKKRKKNPDFLLVGKKKVIEIGDTNYWHTMDEIKQTVKDYECIGYKCLYLTDKDVMKKGWEKKVYKFIK